MNERKAFLKLAKNEDDTTTRLCTPTGWTSTGNTKRPTASEVARREGKWLVVLQREQPTDREEDLDMS